MAIGRPMPPLILHDMERETLERWVRRPKTAQALALRARMILGCAEGRSNTTVGTHLGVSDETVGKWRSRFPEERPGTEAGRTVGRTAQRTASSGYR